MPVTVASNHNPRFVLLDGARVRVFEGRIQLAEYVAPGGMLLPSDVEYLRTQEHKPMNPQGKEPA